MITAQFKEPSELTTRRKVAWLELNGKSYDVYEGVNTIGRDLKANIKLKDVKFSKQHALICVVNDNDHYICDFSSSNGTYVNDKILVPLILYKLNDSENIQLSDCCGVYYKNNSKKQIQSTVTYSQNSENEIFNLQTQKINLVDTNKLYNKIQVNEVSNTFLCDQDEHEAVTQVFSGEKPVLESTSCSEASSQALVIDETVLCDESLPNVSNDNLCLMKTIDETIFDDSSDKDSDDFDIMKDLNESQDDIVIFKSKRTRVIYSEETEISDTDIDNRIEKLIKNSTDDGDITDCETDEMTIKKVLKRTGVIVSDDSDSNMEKNEKADDSAKSNECNLANRKPINDNDDLKYSDDEKDFMKSTQQLMLSSCKDKNKENSVPLKNSEPISVNVQSVESNFEDDEIFLMSTQVLNENKVKTQSNNIPNYNESDCNALAQLNDKRENPVADISNENQTPVKLSLSCRNINTLLASESKFSELQFLKIGQLIENKNNDLNDEDDFLIPTQPLAENFYENTDCKNSNQKSDKPDDIFLLPTQKLSTDRNDLEAHILKQSVEDEDIFSIATQKLSVVNNKKKQEDEIKKVSQPVEDDDVFMMATQPLATKKTTENNQQTAQRATETQIQDEDDVFLMATQKLLVTKKPKNEGSDKCDKPNPHAEENDIFLLDTQKLSSNKKDLDKNKTSLQTSKKFKKLKKSPKPEEDDDIFLIATQELSMTKKSSSNFNSKKSLASVEDDDIFMIPTQQLSTIKEQEQKVKKSNDEEDDIFLVPTQELSMTKKSSDNFNSKKLLAPVEDDDIFMIPTQLLSTYKEQEQKVKKSNDEPSQSADVFMVTTQQLSTKVITEQADKSSQSVNNVENSATEEIINNSLDLNDSVESLKLILSENSIITVTDSTSSNLNTPEELETQIEVDFDLQVTKVCSKQDTSRPSNPLAVMFDDKDSQNTEMELYDSQNDDDLNHEICNAETQIVGFDEKSRGSDEVSVGNNLRKLNNSKQETNKQKQEKFAADVSNIAVVDAHNTFLAEIKSHNTRGIINRRPSVVKSKPSNSRARKTSIKEKFDEISKVLNEPYVKLKRMSIEEMLIAGKKRFEGSDGAEGNETVTKPTKTYKSARESNLELQESVQKEPNLRCELKSAEICKKAKIKSANKNSPKNEPETSISMEKVEISALEKEFSKPKRNYKRVKGSDISKSIVDEPSNRHKRNIRSQTLTDDSDASSTENSDDCVKLSTCKKQKLNKTSEVKMIIDSSTDEMPKRKNRITEVISNDAPVSPRTRKTKLNFESLDNSFVSKSKYQQHKIVFTMLNDSTLKNVVDELGGVVVDSIYDCTVLVTNKISRSLKFLLAISMCKPIVGTEWVEESKIKNKFLDPWLYILEDTDNEMKYDFKLQKSLEQASKSKLLEGYKILLAVSKNLDVLKEICESSGAKCISRVSKGAKILVVSYEEDKAKYARYLKLKPPLMVVAAEAIFSGVLRQELQLERYLLT